MNRRRLSSAVFAAPGSWPGLLCHALVISVVGAGGCSLLLPETATERPPDRMCRRSRTAPIADTALGAASAVAATTLALAPCRGDDAHNFCNGGVEIVALATAVTSAIFAGSATYGYVTASDCSPAPPSQLPEFSLTTTDGRVVTSKELRGRIVLFDFWAGWCRPCLRTEPRLRELAREFANDDVVVLAVNIEAEGTALPEYGGDDITVVTGGGQMAQRAGITSLPSYLLFDRRGALVTKIGGANRDHIAELRAHLNELVADR